MKAKRPSSRCCRKKPLTCEPSTLTAVRKPVTDEGRTQAATEKLCAVSITRSGMSTKPLVPSSSTARRPTMPVVNDAPPTSVPSWSFNESSAASSSKRHAPATASCSTSAALSGAA